MEDTGAEAQEIVSSTTVGPGERTRGDGKDCEKMVSDTKLKERVLWATPQQ